jgi:8-oxo-dGTP pyrophosphatase MutT (NUDIX family)
MVPARPASTVIVLRPSTECFEVLMVRRHRRAEFMGDAYVFPGGSVDDVDRGDLARRAVRWDGEAEEAPWRAAALRELVEEVGLALGDVERPMIAEGHGVYEAVIAAGIRLDATRLECLSNWVTPVGLPRRFDTRFYAAVVTREAKAEADAAEVFDAIWVTPSAALEHVDDWNLPFPTQRHLEALVCFDSPEAVMEYARRLDEVPRIEPRLSVHQNGEIGVLLPGEPGYEAAVK